MDNQSITHTRWNCTYHIVFIPKYRRKIMYGELKRDINVWGIKEGHSRNHKKVVRDETSCPDRWQSMQRSYSYVCGNSPENECIGIYVISEGEKHVDAF